MITNSVKLESFTVHQKLAYFWSPVLKAAFEGQFMEGTTITMEMTDTRREAIPLLIGWMYSGKIDDINNNSPSSQDLYCLWILADKLLIPELQNCTMLAIQESATKVGVPLSSSPYVYSATMPDSQLRRIMAHHIAFAPDMAKFTRESLKILSEEFQIDLLLAQRDHHYFRYHVVFTLGTTRLNRDVLETLSEELRIDLLFGLFSLESRPSLSHRVDITEFMVPIHQAKKSVAS